jgi:hypothetical protein
MARLYTAMEKAYPAGIPEKARDHEISVTLARILFLMFGDDTDMWPENLFQDFILDHTDPDGSDIGAQLTALFAYLDTRPEDRANAPAAFDGFRYVNGGIFTERLPCPRSTPSSAPRCWTPATGTGRPSAQPSSARCSNPSATPETRRELGEHYTSEENILKTLNPLFLDELRAEFEHVQDPWQVRSRPAPQAARQARPHPLHGPRLRLRQLHHRRLPRTARPRARHHGTPPTDHRRPTRCSWPTSDSRSPSTTSTASRSTNGQPGSPKPPCSSSTDSATSNSPPHSAGHPTGSPSKNRPRSWSAMPSSSTGRPCARPPRHRRRRQPTVPG